LAATLEPEYAMTTAFADLTLEQFISAFMRACAYEKYFPCCVNSGVQSSKYKTFLVMGECRVRNTKLHYKPFFVKKGRLQSPKYKIRSLSYRARAESRMMGGSRTLKKRVEVNLGKGSLA
jgi:hypothetical protein